MVKTALSEAQSRRKCGSPQEKGLSPVSDVVGNGTISLQSFRRSLPVGNGKRRKGHLEHELRFLEATWGCPNPRERYGYRVTRVVAEVTLRRGLRERRRQGEGSQELVSAAEVGLDGLEDPCSTRQRVLESYSAMKVARWVREETVGKGLSSGNHLECQAGRDNISTSLAVYFMSEPGKAWNMAKGGRSFG